jgi:hypothetical protein
MLRQSFEIVPFKIRSTTEKEKKKEKEKEKKKKKENLISDGKLAASEYKMLSFMTIQSALKSRTDNSEIGMLFSNFANSDVEKHCD